MYKSSPAKVRSTDHNKESDDRSMKSFRALQVHGFGTTVLMYLDGFVLSMSQIPGHSSCRSFSGSI